MLEGVGSYTPPRVAGLDQQKDTVTLDHEEFMELFEDTQFTWQQRAFQVVSFLLFLGPIRLVFGLIVFFAFIFVIIMVRLFVKYFKLPTNTGKHFNWWLGKMGLRILMYALGIFYIKTEGEYDTEARTIISNHISVTDAFVLLQTEMLSPLVKQEVSKISMLRIAMECVDPVYIDRSKASGVTKQLTAIANDPSCIKLLVFPEGAIPNGDALLSFHKGAFLTGKKVQPVTQQFWMPLVPAGWNTFQWASTFWDHVWCLVSMPPSILYLKYLPAIDCSKGESITSYAFQAQMAMANELSIRAIANSSNERYRPKSE